MPRKRPSVEDLWPGLGEILGDAKEADLVTIGFPPEIAPGVHEVGRPQEGTFDPKARSYLLRKAAARGARGSTPARGSSSRPVPVATWRARCRDDVQQSPFRRKRGLCRFRRRDPSRDAEPRRSPGRGRRRCRSESPVLVDLDSSGVRSPAATASPPPPASRRRTSRSSSRRPRGPPSEDAALERFARLLDGDFGPDSRAVTAAAAKRRSARRVPIRRANRSRRRRPDTRGRHPPAARLVRRLHPDARRNGVRLGRGLRARDRRLEEDSRSRPAPSRRASSLSLANGPLAARLVGAREGARRRLAKAAVGVAADARPHGRRDPREAPGVARRARRALEDAHGAEHDVDALPLRGAEQHVRPRARGAVLLREGRRLRLGLERGVLQRRALEGKKIPELPLLQPEKVSDTPLALTFDDAYAYTLAGEDTVNGVPCWALDFTPRAVASEKPLYAGTVWVAKADFAAIRTRTRQLNLTAEIQAVDEVSGLRRGSRARRRAAFAPPHAHDRTVDPQDVLADDRRRAGEHAFERTARRRRVSPPSARRPSPHRTSWSGTRRRACGISRRRRTAGASSPRTRSAGICSASAASSTTAPSTTRFPLLGVYYVEPRRREATRAAAGLLRRDPPRRLVQPAAPLRDGHRRRRRRLRHRDPGIGRALRGRDGGQDPAREVALVRGELQRGPSPRPAREALGDSRRDASRLRSRRAPRRRPPSSIPVRPLGHAPRGAEPSGTSAGWALSGRYAWNKRSRWDPWGCAGNPGLRPRTRTSTVRIPSSSRRTSTSRASSAFRRLSRILGSDNTDRFSEVQLRVLRRNRPARLSLGSAPGRGGRHFAVRVRSTSSATPSALEVIYDDARVKDPAAGLDWAYFSGAGLSGEAAWPVVDARSISTPARRSSGRNRGQTGAVASLTFLKIF